jgi:hypothetical protein
MELYNTQIKYTYVYFISLRPSLPLNSNLAALNARQAMFCFVPVYFAVSDPLPPPNITINAGLA